MVLVRGAASAFVCGLRQAGGRPAVYPESMFAPGDTVAGYVIETYLGGGGAADVYRAHRSADEAVVALKILHTDATNHDRARERFTTEFAIAAMLRHPHIVAMFEQGEIDAHPVSRTTALHAVEHPPAPAMLWMTMQFVDGPQSTVLVPQTGGQPDLPTIVRIAGQIADALDYAHSQDVLHRDVKPANILLTADHQNAYLTDFGIAQLVDDAKPLARNGRVAGSINYASPELLQGQQLSPATDLYGLACTMFEWLSGKPPYPRANPFATTYAHIRGAIPRLSDRRAWLPSGLNAVFAKALAKDPARRYDSCAEFVDIVGRTLHDVPIPEPGADTPWWRRRS